MIKRLLRYFYKLKMINRNSRLILSTLIHKILVLSILLDIFLTQRSKPLSGIL